MTRALLALLLREAAAKSWNLCESCRWMGDCRCFPDCFSAAQCDAMPHQSSSAATPNCTAEHGYAKRYDKVLHIRRRWRQYHLNETQPAPLSRLIAEAEASGAAGSAAASEPDVDCTVQRAPHPQCFTRMVHQSWATATMPHAMRVWSESWQLLNPGFEYKLWTDADNRAFIEQHYPW